MLFHCPISRNKIFIFRLDSLTLYDGDSIGSPMLGKYCGVSIPPSHISSSNKILVHFQSDGSITHTGFRIEYNPTGKQHISIQNNTENHGDI